MFSGYSDEQPQTNVAEASPFYTAQPLSQQNKAK